MSELFSVYRYERNSIALAVSEITGLSALEVQGKFHFNYIMEILERHKIETVVVERNYIDRDYLSDYTHFHARSFNQYSRFCTRLHFFEHDFTDNRFRHMIALGRQGDVSTLQDAYRGFSVIRPFPGRFVGRTCLQLTAHHDDWVTPLLQTYSVGLFGFQLSVRNSLAFQEQDTVVAACATCAVWFALNTNGDRFVPSPGSITRKAINHDSDGQRVFPSNGLDMKMIVRALKREHYDVVVEDFLPPTASAVDAEPENVVRDVKRLIYAYLRGRAATPILGVNLCEITEGAEGNGVGEAFARHAVSVVGFRLDKGTGAEAVQAGISAERPEKEGPALLADCIDRFLLHDDQIGPFCEMDIVDRPQRVMVDGQERNALQYLRHAPEGVQGEREYGRRPYERVFQIPSLIALAAYHKIRLQLRDMIPYVGGLDRYLRLQVKNYGEEYAELLRPVMQGDRFVWDIYVGSSTDVKQEIRTTLQGLKPEGGAHATAAKVNELVLTVMTASLPRYVWRATAYAEDLKTPLLDLVVDATDTVTLHSLLMPIFYTEDLRTVFAEVFSSNGEHEAWWSHHNVSPLVNALVQFFRQRSRMQELDADARFGRAEPPRFIKPHEFMPGTRRVANQLLNGSGKRQCFSVPSRASMALSDETEALQREITEFLEDCRDNTRSCIWLLDENCNLVIGLDADPPSGLGEDGDKMGHPTLIGGGRARISGELKHVAGKGWLLTNESGRYSRLKMDRGKPQLAEACQLFQQRVDLFQAGLAHHWHPEHGADLFSDAKSLLWVIKDKIEGKRGHRRKTVRQMMLFVQEWADQFSHDSTADQLNKILQGVLEEWSVRSVDEKVMIVEFFHICGRKHEDILKDTGFTKIRDEIIQGPVGIDHTVMAGVLKNLIRTYESSGDDVLLGKLKGHNIFVSSAISDYMDGDLSH